MWTAGANQTRLVCSKPGYYHIGACLGVTFQASNRLVIRILRNGATVVAERSAGQAAATNGSIDIHKDVQVAVAGDYFEIQGFSAVASTQSGNQTYHWADIRWVCP